MTAALMELLNDNEYELLVEAMYTLREKKVTALHEARQHPATQSFTVRDFGVPQIDALLTRLDAKVPMEEADAAIANHVAQRVPQDHESLRKLSAEDEAAVIANGNVRIPLKDEAAVPLRNDRELAHQMRLELLWIYNEVWPLVHGLNSRECVQDRFKRLPDLINATAPLPPGETSAAPGESVLPITWPSKLAVAGMAREVWGNPIPQEAYRFANALHESVKRLNAAPVVPAPAAEVGIRLEGGVIQSIWSNRPMNVLVIDYDTEGRPDDELFDLPQDGGGTSECAIEEFSAVVMPDENERIRSSRVAREPEGPRP